MPDDTVTTSWKRFTDKLIRLWGEPAEDHFTEIPPAPVLQEGGLTARHPEAQPATSHSSR